MPLNNRWKGLVFPSATETKANFFLLFPSVGFSCLPAVYCNFFTIHNVKWKNKTKIKEMNSTLQTIVSSFCPSVHSVLLLTCLALCQTKTQTQIDKSKDGLFLCVSACASSHPLIWSFSLLNSLLSQSNKAAGLVRLIQTQIHMNIVIFDVVPWLTLPDTGSLKWPFVLQKKM